MGFFGDIFEALFSTEDDTMDDNNVLQEAKERNQQFLVHRGISKNSRICGKEIYELNILKTQEWGIPVENNRRANESVSKYLRRVKVDYFSKLNQLGFVNEYDIPYEDLGEDILVKLSPDIIFLRIEGLDEIEPEEVLNKFSSLGKRKTWIIIELSHNSPKQMRKKWEESGVGMVYPIRYGNASSYDKEYELSNILKDIIKKEEVSKTVEHKEKDVEKKKTNADIYLCELCGGTSWKKENSMFVCKSCGCEYNLNEMRNLLHTVDNMKQERKAVSSAQHSSNKIIWQNKKVKITNASPIVKVRVKGTQETFNVGGGISDKALSMIPQIGNFYVGNYLCPDCKSPMYKTNFPVGKEVDIEISNGGIHSMKRVFTCRDCMSFFTAKKDLLSDGEVYVVEFDKVRAYDTYFDELNEKGTTQGRAD